MALTSYRITTSDADVEQGYSVIGNMFLRGGYLLQAVGEGTVEQGIVTDVVNVTGNGIADTEARVNDLLSADCQPIGTPVIRGDAITQRMGKITSSAKSTGQLSQPFNVLSTTSETVTSNIGKYTGAGNVTVVDKGTGYAVNDIVEVQGGTPVDADTTCLLTVTSVTAGAVNSCTVLRPGIYTTAPGAASTLKAVTGSGTGATVTTTNSTTGCSSIRSPLLWNRTDATAFDYFGSNVGTVNASYTGSTSGNGTQFRIEFMSDADELNFRFIGVNSNYDLYVDGKRISATALLTDASGAPYTYRVKFSSPKVRSFSLVGINTAFGGVYTGPAFTVWKKEDKRPVVWQLGDSYTYGTSATQQSFNDFRIVCDNLGFLGLADGIGGTGWTSTSSKQPQERIKAKLATLSKDPDYVFLTMAYNDAGGNMTLAETNFRESVALVRQIKPKAKIIVIGTATPLGGTANLQAITSVIKGAAEDLGLPYVDMYDVVNTRNAAVYTSPDNTHPNDAGYSFRAYNLTEKLKAVI